MEYTAVVKRCGEWWIGWIEEVPGVNCQERTHEELRQSLADALAEAHELRHIANATARRRIETVCRDSGIEPPVLCTPEELTETEEVDDGG